jgi:hypothetical protein
VSKSDTASKENLTKVAQAEFVTQSEKQNLKNNFGGDFQAVKG